MNGSVFSEIARLKKVMIHRPGKEVDVIVPDLASDVLFEDIIFGELARKEHDLMKGVFKKYGVKTYDILDLLIESLKEAPKAAIKNFLLDLGNYENLPQDLVKELESYDPVTLGHALIEGVLLPGEKMSDKHIYLLPPIPNLLFARDPVIMVHNKILASSMAEQIRKREAKLMIFIFTHHPQFKAPDSIIDLEQIAENNKSISLEGGDFLVLDKKTSTIAIAWSKRTGLESIKILAGELGKIGIKNLIVVKLPHKNAFIHLDTSFTRINHHECLIYPPLYAKESEDPAKILYFDLTANKLKEVKYNNIFDCLEELGIYLEPIYCGGKNSLIAQKREQWTHGTNAFCIAPGIILYYSRNINTIKELSKKGYLCISAEEVLKDTFIPNFNQKTAILLDSEELCRARGGPRCMVHPLHREN